MKIQIEEKFGINGASQFVSIRAEQEGLPLLVYLHGGPGDAALPMVLKYNSPLEKYFTVAVWEQRGAGKSYYKFKEGEQIGIDTYVQDLYTLVQLLLKRFRQQKVYLVGHSWGSVIGLTFCREYPSFVHTYIGCGQVVNMKRSCQEAYEFAMQHASGKEAERLSQIDCSYTGEQWLKDLLFVTKQVVKYKGSLYGESNYNRFVFDVVFSSVYGGKGLIDRQRGALQSIQYLWQELMQVSFDTTAFETPLVFIEGRFDRHVSSELVREYFDTITSPKTFHWFEKSCHFPQWSEAEKFNSILTGLLNP